jgi:hypothetical protein
MAAEVGLVHRYVAATYYVDDISLSTHQLVLLNATSTVPSLAVLIKQLLMLITIEQRLVQQRIVSSIQPITYTPVLKIRWQRSHALKMLTMRLNLRI